MMPRCPGASAPTPPPCCTWKTFEHRPDASGACPDLALGAGKGNRAMAQRVADFGTKFKNPNFAAMADAVGVRGIRLEDPGDVEHGIAEALAHDGPVLVDAVVSRMVLPIPPSITVEMAKGFTLYMLKAVMGGRGDDLIDLAKANLWD